MNTSNKNITFRGSLLHISGDALAKGEKAPNFKLVDLELKDVTPSDFSGKTIILSVVPSVDTPTCAAQTKHFNAEIERHKNIVVLTVSLDLPFAQRRFCDSEKCSNINFASDYKYRTFGKTYGVYIEELGLLCRAVFAISPSGEILHVEYVQNISDEPDYKSLLDAI